MFNWMRNRIGWLVLFVTAVAAVQALAAQDMPAVTPRYGVVEVTLTCSDRFDNPFRDAVCTAEFVSPSGTKTRVEGFYDGGDQWRVPFCPARTWELELERPDHGRRQTG